MKDLTLQQKQILLYIKKHPRANNIEIARNIGINAKQGISYQITRLMAMGYLKQIKRWQLTKQATKVLGDSNIEFYKRIYLDPLGKEINMAMKRSKALKE